MNRLILFSFVLLSCFIGGTVWGQRDPASRFVNRVWPETVRPFYSSVGESFDGPLNEFWRLFVCGGNYGQHKEKFMGGIMFWDAPEFSGGCNWSEQKNYWYNDVDVRTELRHRLIRIPFDQGNRYLWSTDGSRLHVFQQRIITTNPELITKTWEVLRWENPEFAEKWLHSTQDFGIGYLTVAGEKAELCSPNDFVSRVGDFDNTLEQTFIAHEPIAEISLKLLVTDKSIYRLRLVNRQTGEDVEQRIFRGTEDHGNKWTHWKLTQELPPGEYVVELKNVAHEVLGTTMDWQNNAKYNYPLGWYGSEFDSYPEGANGMNGWIGETPYQRLIACMEYMLADHSDSTTVAAGLTIITHPNQTGIPVSMENRDSVSLPSTYYDLVRTGYKDAFTNLRWREAYYAMMQLEHYFGDPTKAEEYRNRVLEATNAFRKTFWNSETGRYVGWIDKEGTGWDFGEVAINLMAIHSNHKALLLGAVDDPEGMKAEHRTILDWIRGNREVAGDTSRGEDIYFFGFAPRKNTLAYETLGRETNHWWGGWYYSMRPEGDGRGNFGLQEENGGTNPYIGFYDVMASLVLADESDSPEDRQHYINDAWNRYYVASNSVIKEFAKDKFYRPTEHPPWEPHPDDRYQVYVMALPESGLPVNVSLEGFLGVSVTPAGIKVEPMLPEGIEMLGVRNFLFQGTVYQIEANSQGDVKIMRDNLAGNEPVPGRP